MVQANNERSCASRGIIVCCVEGFGHFLVVGSCAVLGSALPDLLNRREATFDTDRIEPFVSGALLMFALKGCFLSWSSSAQEGEACDVRRVVEVVGFWEVWTV